MQKELIKYQINNPEEVTDLFIRKPDAKTKVMASFQFPGSDNCLLYRLDNAERSLRIMNKSEAETAVNHFQKMTLVDPRADVHELHQGNNLDIEEFVFSTRISLEIEKKLLEAELKHKKGAEEKLPVDNRNNIDALLETIDNFEDKEQPGQIANILSKKVEGGDKFIFMMCYLKGKLGENCITYCNTGNLRTIETMTEKEALEMLENYNKLNDNSSIICSINDLDGFIETAIKAIPDGEIIAQKGSTHFENIKKNTNQLLKKVTDLSNFST